MKTKIKIALIAAALIFASIIGGFLILFVSKNLSKPQVTSEQYNRIFNQLDKNKKVVDCLLKILDEKDIAIEDRDKTIERWITNYRELETKLAQRSTEETLIAKAKDKLTVGDLNATERLLIKSFEYNLKDVSEKGKVAASDAFDLGVIKELQIDYYGAKRFFEQAILLDMENTNYLNRYGKNLEILGKHKEAAEYYDKALLIDRYGIQHPKVINDYKMLSEAFYNLGKHQKTNNFYEEVLSFLDSMFGCSSPNTQTVKVDWEAIKSELEAMKKEKQNAKNQ